MEWIEAPAASSLHFAHEQIFWQPLIQLHDIALFIDIGQAGSVDGQGTAFMSQRDHPQNKQKQKQ